jgi:predicted nucleic acid-binding protein
MTTFESVFIDSVSFIYLVENHPKYFDRVSQFLIEEVVQNENILITSVLTISEFSVRPIRDNDKALLLDFTNVLDRFNFKVFDITLEIARKAASLRALYPYLKTVDALQLATAIIFGCSRFLTNDFKLKKYQNLK